MTLADLWDTVPGLTPTVALCLLAVEHAEATGQTHEAVGGRPPLVEVQTVAAVTGRPPPNEAYVS